MIIASFDSKCPGCESQICEGDNIGLVGGEWCCERCVDDNGGEDLEV